MHRFTSHNSHKLNPFSCWIVWCFHFGFELTFEVYLNIGTLKHSEYGKSLTIVHAHTFSLILFDWKWMQNGCTGTVESVDKGLSLGGILSWDFWIVASNEKVNPAHNIRNLSILLAENTNSNVLLFDWASKVHWQCHIRWQ